MRKKHNTKKGNRFGFRFASLDFVILIRELGEKLEANEFQMLYYTYFEKITACETQRRKRGVVIHSRVGEKWKRANLKCYFLFLQK